MRNALLQLLPLGFLASCSVEAGPCQNYCDYICSCHEGEADYDCESCYTEYSAADPQLEDECSTELTTLKADDAANATGCDAAGDDTAAG